MNRTRIKFCGFTRAEDVALAAELGVDYVGLVFAPRSPRRLSLGQAKALREAVPAGIGAVALLMDNPADEVAAIVAALAPDILQFHGGESDAFAAGFGLPFWKAVAMGGQGADASSEFARHPAASAFLLDGHGAGEQGGSGKPFDWTRMPKAAGKPLLLAGGLAADNVGLAIGAARPWGVDVSSGIESAPGIKDPAKMRAFAEAVRRADAATRPRIV
jgi:phosphoribosylanthranilate isomerase